MDQCGPARCLRRVAAARCCTGREPGEDIARPGCSETWRRRFRSPSSVIVRCHIGEAGDHGAQFASCCHCLIGRIVEPERVDQLLHLIAVGRQQQPARDPLPRAMVKSRDRLQRRGIGDQYCVRCELFGDQIDNVSNGLRTRQPRTDEDGLRATDVLRQRVREMLRELWVVRVWEARAPSLLAWRSTSRLRPVLQSQSASVRLPCAAPQSRRAALHPQSWQTRRSPRPCRAHACRRARRAAAATNAAGHHRAELGRPADQRGATGASGASVTGSLASSSGAVQPASSSRGMPSFCVMYVVNEQLAIRPPPSASASFSSRSSMR